MAVAVAGDFFQRRTVADANAAALSTYRSTGFQPVQSVGYAGASRSEHPPQKFMRQRYIIAVGAILRHQQPSRQTLFIGETSIGERGMRNLDEKRIGPRHE